MAHLLIVEDDAITALALQHAVTQMGHQVVARTASAAAAMAAVQAYRPDAVLLGRGLAASQDGLMVGTDIRTLWATPVIYLSGSDPVQFALPEFPEALYCVLAKPLDWDQLRDTLAHLSPAQPVRHTAQELRERLRQLRAHLAALQQHSRHRRRCDGAPGRACPVRLAWTRAQAAPRPTRACRRIPARSRRRRRRRGRRGAAARTRAAGPAGGSAAASRAAPASGGAAGTRPSRSR